MRHLRRLTVERSFSDELTIDPETGLPALPDEYVWEVSRTMDRLGVSLKKRSVELLGFWAKLFGQKPEVYLNEYIDGYRFWEPVALDYTNAEGILAASVSLYEEIHASTTKLNELDAFVGIYPPKSIL
jgi:hypothetical protein